MGERARLIWGVGGEGDGQIGVNGERKVEDREMDDIYVIENQ